MASTKNNFNIELLNGNNYMTWKFRVKVLLEEKGVCKWTKTEFNPNIYSEEKVKELELKQDKLCKSILVQCLDDSQLDIVSDKENACQMWKALKDRYEKKGLHGQMFLKKKLMSLRLKEGESLENHIAEFENIIRQLITSGCEISDEDKVCNLLLSLPRSYETVSAIIENSSEISYEEAKNKLFGENEKRTLFQRNSNSNHTGQTAFSVMNHGPKCYGCGVNGHIKRHCPKNKSFRQNYQSQFQQETKNYENQRRGYRGNRGYVYGRGFQGNHKRPRDGHQGDTAHSNLAEEPERSQEDTSVCFMGESRTEYNSEETTGILKFFIDSGCTDHMVNEKEVFSSIVMLKVPIKISVAKNDDFLLAIGVGNIKVISDLGNEKINCTLKNVLYVPDLRKNLLSVKKLEISDMKILFENSHVKLINKDGQLVGLGKRENLYEIQFLRINVECMNIESNDNDFVKWHKRYGHIGFSGLREIIKKHMVEGLENIKIQDVEFCQPCISGKMTRFPFTERTKAKRILEIIHSDVCGPITPSNHDESRYFVTFIDDYSNFCVVYLIKEKKEVFSKFKEFATMVEGKFNSKITILRCDNGGEYSSNDFRMYCAEKGYILDYTVAYTPEQNGKAERKNRSLVERARAILEESGILKEYWGEAILAINYIMNRGTSSGLNKTPSELWYGKKPNVSNFRVFGCMAYCHIPKECRGKFDSKVKKCIMMGYAQTGYRLWDIDKQKLIVARDVIFNENEFWYKRSVSVRDDEYGDKTEENKQSETENDEIEAENDDGNNERMILERVESKRSVRMPKKFSDYELFMAFDACSFIENVPINYEELEMREDKEKWLGAVERELKSIEMNETWEKVEKPRNSHILDTKWVFAYKSMEENEIDRFKARLVVRGFAQKYYDEIYSPVARMTTIRALLIVGNQLGYIFHQLDVKTAFLNGFLNEDIYIFPPKGINIENNSVFKLKKSLYGLKQSSKCWNDEINRFLLEIGFYRSESDFCLYALNTKSEEKIFLLIYVDDIILCGSNECQLNEVKYKLMQKFKMKDKGNLKYFLGLEIDYNRQKGILRISQAKYIQNLLIRFKMEDCNGCSTPIEKDLKIDRCNDQNKTSKPFRELVGCLMYLMLGTRLDICFAVNFYSRFQDKATDQTFCHLKRVLRYLKATPDIGIEYTRNNIKDLCCYVDSDWGSDALDRRSVTGYIFKLFGNTICWTTKKQTCVSLSTTEAELIALCSSVCEGLWLRKLLVDLSISFDYITFYEDNQGCIALIKNPTSNRRVKHIDLKFHFIYENVQNGKIKLVFVETHRQEADILTKGLSVNLFVKFRELSSLKDFSEGGC